MIGDPIAHSRSPLIHNHWLEQHGIAGLYSREHVTAADFPRFVRSLAARGYVGANVTLPHKEAAAALCDRLTPVAAALGAVNTVWLEDGALHGDNTDVEGFMVNLATRYPDWRSTTHEVLLVGAGGAARGIAWGLKQAGVAIAVTNRSPDKAEALREMGLADAVWPWNERSARLAGADLIVNTTALGMKGQPPFELALETLPPHAIVCDIVYVPLETSLLGAASARGLRTVDGLGMLLYQAVPGFARWFGVRPAVTPELRQLIENDVLGRAT